MKHVAGPLIKIGLLVLVWVAWWWALDASLPQAANLLVIAGALLLVFPVVWIARKILDRNPGASRVEWITTGVHYAVGMLFGLSIIRAVTTYQDWPGPLLPIPAGIGLIFAILSAAAFLMTVGNLALKGLGAPFAIALSQELAVDWLYAWTRNPMVLAALALLVSVGIWFQSALFVMWALLLFTPSLLFFVKVYEERELEFRFGASYLDYHSRTPMLFPRKPRNNHP
jgi:protein-S-isoprenylcysteine O-methyltransferase Ste14